MGELRIFLRAQHLLAAGLIALALAMKVLVPAGYMLNQGGAGPLLMICPKANPGMNLDPQMNAPAEHASHGGHAAHAGHHVDAAPQDAHHDGGAHGNAHDGHKSDNTCPYSVMPMASLSGADGAQLAIALVFILALGFAPVAFPRLAPVAYLRPPLRGPPEALV